MTTSFGTAFIDVRPDLSGFNRELDQSLERSGAKKKFAAVGKTMAAGLAIGGAAFIALGKNAIDAASDINESLSKNRVLFGKYAKDVERFSDKSAKSYGISKKAALEYTGVFGNLFRALGQSEKASANNSVALTKLAADMASFNNTSVDDALEAIRSGLVGETEPLRRFGVNMNDATLRQEALRQGLIQTTKQALTPQQKALAAQALIMRQTSKAHGDFARTSGGLANQQRILSARLSDLQAKLGAALLPAALAVTGALNKLISSASSGTGVFGATADVLKTTYHVVRELLPVAVSLGAAFVAYKAITTAARAVEALQFALGVLRTVYIAQTGVTNASTLAVIRHSVAQKLSAAAAGVLAIATGALNAVMAANPVVLVAVALAALVAGLVLAYQKSETFRNIVNGLFGALKDAGGAVVAFVGGIDKLPGLLEGAGKAVTGGLVGGIKSLPGLLSDAARWLKDRLADAIMLMTAPYRIVGGWILNRIVDGVKTITSLLSGVGGWIRNRISDLIHAEITGLKTIGSWVLNRLVDGFEVVTSLLATIGGWVKNRISDLVRAEVSGLTAIGSWILNRLVDGFTTITSALSGAGGWVKNRLVDSFNAVKNGFLSIGGSIIGWIVDGLKKGANSVVGFLNKLIDAVNILPGVKIGHIATFAQGGDLADAYAQGGVHRGQRLTAPIVLMGEEAPRHPEYVIPTNPAYRDRARMLHAQLGEQIGQPIQALASGGIIGDVGATGATAKTVRAAIQRVWQRARTVLPSAPAEQPLTVNITRGLDQQGILGRLNRFEDLSRQLQIDDQLAAALIPELPAQQLGVRPYRGMTWQAMRDLAQATLLHEWTHNFQSPRVLPANPAKRYDRTVVEGGATAFVNRRQRAAFGDGFTPPTVADTYMRYVSVLKDRLGPKAEEWFTRGQFGLGSTATLDVADMTAAKAAPKSILGDIADAVTSIPKGILSGGAKWILDKFPNPSDLPDWIKGLGSYAVTKVTAWVKDKVTGLLGSSSGLGDISGIVALGKRLQKMGYAVSENPAFGGVHPVHTPGSYHYQGRALDVNADNFPGGEPAALDRLYAMLKKLPGIVELLWRVPGHYDHLHVAMAQGGIIGSDGATIAPFVGSYARGGIVPQDGLAYVHQGETITPASGNPFEGCTFQLVMGGQVIDERIELRISESDRRKTARYLAGAL